MRVRRAGSGRASARRRGYPGACAISAALCDKTLWQSGRAAALSHYTSAASQRHSWRRTAARGDTDVRSTASSGARRPTGAGRDDRRPPRRPAPARRPPVLALRRRRPRRRPARARDLHAPSRLARPGDRARLDEGRREARGPGRPPRPGRGLRRGGRPRRGARRRPAIGRGALRVQRARRALRRGHAAPEARRGPGPDAQGGRTLLQRDRRAARVDLHEGIASRTAGGSARATAGACVAR